jgi:hypothetical protein
VAPPATEQQRNHHAPPPRLDPDRAEPDQEPGRTSADGSSVQLDSVYDTELGRVIRAVALLQTDTFWLGIALGAASWDDGDELRDDAEQIVVAADALRVLVNELVDQRHQDDDQPRGLISRARQQLHERIDGMRAAIR